MSRIAQDFRFAVRALGRGRFVTVLAVLAFAVGIGVTTADKFWPGRNPLGRRISSSNTTDWWEVIGVVNDVKSYGLAAKTPYDMYRSAEQEQGTTMTVVVRTTSEGPGAIIASARQIVSSLDPTLPLTSVQTMEEVVAASVGQP